MRRISARRVVLVAAAVVVVVAGSVAPVWADSSRGRPSAHLGHATAVLPGAAGLSGIHKIQHVVIIMQENRSFDSYFGTYPGAVGIPGLAGNKGKLPCLPDPRHKCIKPFHTRRDRTWGGPHSSNNALGDIHGGAMNGFIVQQEHAPGCVKNPDAPGCASGPEKQVMAYHTGAEIPNYWKYAHDFVLQDHMFQPELSWSLPAHLWLVSEWSALCTSPDPLSCQNALDHPGSPPGWLGNKTPPFYSWTDLTFLLHAQDVSWRYYVFQGTEPDCQQDRLITCARVKQSASTPSIWNPLPYFETVKQDGQLANIQSLSHFFSAARNDRLPNVAWIVPNNRVSEHPPAAVSAGQSYVTGLINTIMQSPEWKSTAIFLTWDDWGGLYDNVDPTPYRVDLNGYGLRVPGLLISPYAKHGSAKHGFIDHHVLSFDAYTKFIEDDFLGGQRLDPTTDGRPDLRPDVRENLVPGDLINEFNFNQNPRKPVLLPVHPKTDFKKPH